VSEHSATTYSASKESEQQVDKTLYAI